MVLTACVCSGRSVSHCQCCPWLQVASIAREGNLRCGWADFSSDSKLAAATVQGQVAVLTKEGGNSSSWQQHDVMKLKDSSITIKKGTWAPDGKTLVVVEGIWWQNTVNPLYKVELGDDMVPSEVWQLGSDCPLAMRWLPAFTWPFYQSQDRIMCLSYTRSEKQTGKPGVLVLDLPAPVAGKLQAGH